MVNFLKEGAQNLYYRLTWKNDNNQFFTGNNGQEDFPYHRGAATFDEKTEVAGGMAFAEMTAKAYDLTKNLQQIARDYVEISDDRDEVTSAMKNKIPRIQKLIQYVFPSKTSVIKLAFSTGALNYFGVSLTTGFVISGIGLSIWANRSKLEIQAVTAIYNARLAELSNLNKAIVSSSE